MSDKKVVYLKDYRKTNTKTGEQYIDGVPLKQYEEYIKYKFNNPGANLTFKQWKARKESIG